MMITSTHPLNLGMMGGIIRGSSLCWQVFLIKEDWKHLTTTGSQ